MATRDELVAGLSARYALSNRIERGQILDEFVAVSGFHRKHAMRLLRGMPRGRRSDPRPSRRLYNDAVREVLIGLWEPWTGFVASACSRWFQSGSRRWSGTASFSSPPRFVRAYWR
jgi:hypothetical protein